MRTLLFNFILLVFLQSCIKLQDNNYYSCLDLKEITSERNFIGNNGWYFQRGHILIDTLEAYKGKASLRLIPTPYDGIKQASAFFYTNMTEIDGDTIIFSGEYKLKNVINGKIVIRIEQDNNSGKIRKDSIIIDEYTKINEWLDFSIRIPLNENIIESFFYIDVIGNMDCYINNCKINIDEHPIEKFICAKYEAEDNNEYNCGSNIHLSTLTPQMLDNLYVLCKVWGFLKYYHPEVAKGKYNWDYELFKILPSIADAKNKEDRDKRLNEWVNKYGKVKDIEDYNYKMKGYPNYSKIINLDWIVNKDLFDERLISKLTAIKNAKRPNSFNYYTVPYQLRNWMPFDREKSYDNIKWDDQGFRILTLFRLWNIIEYCFPYYDLLEADWNSLLKEYIPGIVLPADKIKYELAIKELAGHINDSHGYMDIPDHSLEKTVLSKFYNKYRVPVELIETKNGDIVVKSSELSQFERGDIIIDLDGESVKDEIEQLVPYIMASNRSAMIRDILFFLLSSDKPSLCVTVLRNGQRKIINVQNFEKNQRKQGLKTCNDYKLEFKNIAYISNDNTAKMNEEIINSSINCKGIIVDLRPFDIDIGNQMVLISKILESPQSPLWISINNRNNPGNYSLLPISEFGAHNPKYYKGKIVILVDEHTQSHMESFAMIHRTAPNSIIIGSQTAGTNGAIGIVHLPHGIKFNYTCTGAYYPFWRQLQIKGVDIDVDVRPTTANIRDGRDIYIEKAIEYIVNRKIYEK